MKIKPRSITPRSFTHRKDFPGTLGNPFDRVLHFGDHLQNIPLPILWILFALLAFGVSRFEIRQFGICAIFLITDDLLLRGLPALKISFGPVKPVWLMLEILRLPFWFLHYPYNLAIELLGSILIIYGFYIEPQTVKMRRLTLGNPAHDPRRTITVLHLGDFHVERITKRERKVLALINANKPDLILFSGDFLNLSYLHDPIAQADGKAFLNQLKATYGVFGVKGSPAVDLPELFPDLITGTPLKLLEDQQVQLNINGKPISIIGLTCSHNPDADHDRLLSFYQPNDGFKILLHHSPDLAPLSCRDSFDLQLSGHTHGGQIRIPGFGPLVTGSLYGKQLESSAFRLKEMVLSVTRGIGLEGASAPRVRLFCPPEITFITIHL